MVNVKVFFSYCTADQPLKDIAHKALLPLAKALPEQNIKLEFIAMDEKCVNRWDDWSRDKTIECDIMVPIITEHSFEVTKEGKTKVMLEEIALGVEHSKKLAPMVLCALRGETAIKLQKISLIYCDRDTFEKDCERLAKSVEILALEEAESKRERFKLRVFAKAQKNSKFVGRNEEIEALSIALEKSNIAILVGEGGIGKTTLAEAFFEQNKSRYIDAYIIKAPEGIGKCFENLFIDEKSKALSVQERHDRNKDFFESLNKKTIIIFDNCDVNMTEQEILDELKNIKCRAIITSRDGVDGETQLPILRLGRMDNEELLALVRKHYSNIDKDNGLTRAEADKELCELFEYVDGHTLTVEMASAIMRDGDIPIKKIKEKLLTNGEKIKTEKKSERASAFDHLSTLYNFARLNADEKRVLNALCLISPHIGIERRELKELLELESNNEINALSRKTFLRYNSETRTAAMHPLFADVYYKAEGVYVSEEYKRIASLLANLNSDEADLEKNEKTLQLCLYFAHRRAAELKDKSLLGDIYNTAGRCFGSWGDFAKSLEYKEKGLEARAEAYGGEAHTDIAASYNNLGFTYGKLGDYKSAIKSMERACEIWLDLFGKDTDHPDVSLIYNNMGFTYGKLGEYEKALEYLQKALAMRLRIYGEGTDQEDVAITYNNVGRAYGMLGEREKELEHLEISLRMRERLYGKDSNHPYIALTLNYMGEALDALGKHESAHEHYERAFDIRLKAYKDNPNHPDVARSCLNIGKNKQKTGNCECALEYFKRALGIYLVAYESTPKHPDIAETYESIGDAYAALGDGEKAEEYRKKSRSIKGGN